MSTNLTQVLPICYANNRRSMIKSRWPLCRGFVLHVKKDYANRLADSGNLFDTRFQMNSEKKLGGKKFSRQVPAILIIGGKLKI